jgi:SAM-dependent MidA family methyltransferase
MTAQASPAVSPAFLAAFRQEVGADGAMSFARFMELALYHADVGYYAKSRRRIGRERDTDFFTATSLGSVFGELVVEACRDLLGGHPPGDFTFVEVGAEPPADVTRSKPVLAPPPQRQSESDGRACLPVQKAQGPELIEGQAIPPVPSRASSLLQGNDAGAKPPTGVLAGVANPFAATTTISLGQPLRFPPRSIVFSNELFDAQPCHRLLRAGDCWREIGVVLDHDSLAEILLPELTAEVQAVRDRLPAAAPDGYRIDLPLAAARLAAQIAVQPWAGLFVAFDYGKSWHELTEDTPTGTVRAYLRHRQSNDLLAQPGEQDLTCHVCWGWISEALAAHGFASPVLESQEAFFVHHAAPALNRLIASEADRFTGRKLSVMQLLHPANMGQKFQVLWARRW